MRPADLIAFIEARPGLTATQIARETGTKVDSMSSMLVKLLNARLITRDKGVGPRGGYGYFPLVRYVDRPTAWEHLLND